jgi:hypothetical protein
MAIKSYNSKADYQAAVKPTTESQVSMIETTREIIVDGVNVVTTQPTVGDVVFLDDQNKVIYVKGGAWIQKANIPAAWTHVGYVYFRKGKQVGVIHKTGADQKWLDVSQFAWTDAVLDGAEHSKTIGLRFGIPNWDTTTSITFTYTATTLAEAAAACTAAIEAKLTELGASQATIDQWWAYADAANNRVIVQRDACTDYRFYNCSGLTHITWGDMPAADKNGFRVNGRMTDQKIMNDARGAAYYGTEGATPSADVPLNAAGTIVKKSAFESSPYCQLLRDTYGTYKEYIHREYHVAYPQKLGVFSMPNGKELTAKYGPMTAPTKAGGTKYKFPALRYGYNKSFGVSGLDFGDWYLPGVAEGAMLMRDETLAKLSPSISKMGTTTINNSTTRWFAQRYAVDIAWFFNGYYGFLNNYNVNDAFRCQAVALLEID